MSFVFFAIAAIAVQAQTSDSSISNLPQSPGFAAALRAFNTCVADASIREPGPTDLAARRALATCARRRDVLDRQFDEWVNSSAFPVESRDAARVQYRDEMAGVRAEIAQALDQRRRQARSSHRSVAFYPPLIPPVVYSPMTPYPAPPAPMSPPAN